MNLGKAISANGFTKVGDVVRVAGNLSEQTMGDFTYFSIDSAVITKKVSDSKFCDRLNVVEKVYRSQKNKQYVDGKKKRPKDIEDNSKSTPTNKLSVIDVINEIVKVNKKIIERGGKFVVTDARGEKVLGTHDTKEEALAQLRAVEANKSVNNEVLSILQNSMDMIKQNQDKVVEDFLGLINNTTKQDKASPKSKFDRLVERFKDMPEIKDPEALAATIIRRSKKSIDDIVKGFTNDPIIIKPAFVMGYEDEEQLRSLIRMEKESDKYEVDRIVKELDDNIDINYSNDNVNFDTYTPLYDLALIPRHDNLKITMKQVSEEKRPFHMDYGFNIIKKSSDVTAESGDIFIAGPASTPVIDREGEEVDMAGLKEPFEKFFKDKQFTNFMLQHSNAQVAVGVDEIVDQNGNIIKTHFDVKNGAFVVAKLREGDTPLMRKVRQAALDGKLDSFSIGGEALEKKFVCDRSGKCAKKITDIDLWEITLCEEGQNPEAKFDVILNAKAS
jgi:hypothetical protein